MSSSTPAAPGSEIAELVADRWRQFTAIRETVDAPDVCIVRVSHLLNQCFLETAPLVSRRSMTNHASSGFWCNPELHDVHQRTIPRAAVRHLHRDRAQVRVGRPRNHGSQRLHRPCAQRAEPS